MSPSANANFWKATLRQLKARHRSRSDKLSNSQRRTIATAKRRWEKKILHPWLSDSPERKRVFENLSGLTLNRIYTPRDTAQVDYTRDLGFPGQFPYTRGIYPTMYRGRIWTMRLFSGFGAPEDTNRRLRYLLEHGETGLSIAFDMPTLYGYDADHPRALGEVGKCGVSVSSLEDMEHLFAGIPVGKVSTSMTINAPAAVLTCMYVAVAQKQGVQPDQLRGTVQTDILKEYIAQKEWNYPPEAHLRIIRDMIVYSTKNLPNWNYVSISGYHIREAGSSALQELAFTLADGFEYVKLGMDAGLDVDAFAPRLSFFFNSGMDFFEEVAKFRAARRIWAHVMKNRFRAKDPRSMLLRFHTQTSGVSLTWQQPLNNIVRTAIEALAAVLGGTQSLHTNSYDEAWALPTEDAATIALRTQQTIAEETGVADVIDPLGGSYYLEALTDEMERRAYEYFDRIESLGGVLPAIKDGFFQREIADTAYKYQRQIEQGERTVVGVNQYMIKEQQPLNTLKVDVAAQERQVRRLRELRARRDNLQVKKALENLRRTLENDKANCIAPILDAVKQYATLGEIVDVGRRVFGDWKEPGIL
ncbi:MAG: methylmalonyl-CoA mutase family protein [Candidatus Bathyarchaeia archaeon]